MKFLKYKLYKNWKILREVFFDLKCVKFLLEVIKLFLKHVNFFLIDFKICYNNFLLVVKGFDFYIYLRKRFLNENRFFIRWLKIFFFFFLVFFDFLIFLLKILDFFLVFFFFEIFFFLNALFFRITLRYLDNLYNYRIKIDISKLYYLHYIFRFFYFIFRIIFFIIEVFNKMSKIEFLRCKQFLYTRSGFILIILNSFYFLFYVLKQKIKAKTIYFLNKFTIKFTVVKTYIKDNYNYSNLGIYYRNIKKNFRKWWSDFWEDYNTWYKFFNKMVEPYVEIYKSLSYLKRYGRLPRIQKDAWEIYYEQRERNRRIESSVFWRFVYNSQSEVKKFLLKLKNFLKYIIYLFFKIFMNILKLIIFCLFFILYFFYYLIVYIFSKYEIIGLFGSVYLFIRKNWKKQNKEVVEYMYFYYLDFYNIKKNSNIKKENNIENQIINNDINKPFINNKNNNNILKSRMVNDKIEVDKSINELFFYFWLRIKYFFHVNYIWRNRDFEELEKNYMIDKNIDVFIKHPIYIILNIIYNYFKK